MSEITFIGERGTEYRISSLGMYSDSTTMVKTEDFDKIVRQCDTVLLRPSTLSAFLAGLSVVDGVTSHGGHIKRLLLPYLPGARQDRANPTGDVGFMLQTVARMVNTYRFDEVVVVDPHSEMAGALFDRFRPYPYERLYGLLNKETAAVDYHAVIAPDHGAVARANLAAEVLGLPVVQAEKTRDPADGSLSGFAVNVEKGKHYIVVDDICDGGGTFIGLGDVIWEQGATADLFVTHGIFSKPRNMRDLLRNYERIYTTNTRDVETEQVQVLDVLTDMKEASR